jgi:hypothetical protein
LNTDVLESAISDPGFTEDLALSLLKRSDLPTTILELLSKKTLANSRKVRFALVAHPKTPRHISVTLLRQLFTFDLMRLALTPVVAPDLKVAAERALMDRLEKLTSGERLSLARRSSGAVASALLLDSDPRISNAALDNSRLTEALLTRAITAPRASAAFIRAVCDHAKWSLRRDVRAALLRTEKLPLSRALEYAHSFPPIQVREILQNSRLPGGIKARVLEELARKN